MLSWGFTKCLENSLKDFLTSEISNDNVTDIDDNNIPVRVGRKEDANWSLPCISVYCDSEVDPKIFIGSNYIDRTILMIIDIFTTNEGERLDVANWLTDKIKNGFRYYTYTPNLSDPDLPNKTAGHLVNVDFLTNRRINLGQTIDEFDAHRHQITINVYITGA